MIDIASEKRVPNIYIDVPFSEPQRPPEIVLPRDFDSTRYRELNPDVAVAGVDPAEHYVAFGAREGRGIAARVGAVGRIIAGF